MSRFAEYERLKGLAIDQTKQGGDPLTGLVFALLAQAEMTAATETDELNLHFSNSLEVT